MENKKSSLITGLIIGVLVGIIACLVVYITLDKKDNDKKEDKKDTQETKKDDKIDDEDLPIAYQYTAKFPQTCRKISTLDGTVYDDRGISTGIVDIDTDKYTNIFDYILEQKDIKIVITYYKPVDNEIIENKYTLTKDETNNFLNNMKNSTISLKEVQLGGVYIPKILITYNRNNEEKFIEFLGSISFSCLDDMNLFKIIDSNLLEEEDNPNMYIIDNFDESIFELVGLK